jgi:DNA-binding GntR family transcriptional regulator
MKHCNTQNSGLITNLTNDPFNKGKLTMNKTIPKYVAVQNKIKEASSRLEMIDKIPGERVLAKRYGVSYMTLRKSVEHLVADKILYKIPTHGTYVVQPTRVHSRVVSIRDYFD